MMEIALSLMVLMLSGVAIFCALFWFFAIGITTIADYINLTDDK